MLSDPHSRQRVVSETWYRDPEGAILPRPPPTGRRPANGLIWGNDLNSFFWTWRIPNHNLVTIWSRSMIQEFGENHFKQEQLNIPEPDPVLINPYPLLRLAPSNGVEKSLSSVLSNIYSGRNDGLHVNADLSAGIAEEGCHSPLTSKGVTNGARPAVASISKLEELIPGMYFPDILLVNDPDKVADCKFAKPLTTTSDWSARPPVKYKRMMPTAGASSAETTHSMERTIDISDSDVDRVAHLRISGQDLLGVGHHSLVYSAAFIPPAPLAADTPTGEVRVAAKLAFPQPDQREMLEKEASIYNKFPKHLMEIWSGFNLVTPHKYPVPVDPVVPKFFGYYVPAEEENSSLSPILLLEECGAPVTPKELKLDHQSQCYTHVLRLHYADFMQNSMAVRNIMMQPGPLTVHPDKRSLEHPSFRIIDFGRGEFFDDWLVETHKIAKLPDDPVQAECKYRGWMMKKSEQEMEVRREMGVDLADA